MFNMIGAFLAAVLFQIACRGNGSLFELFIVCSITLISTNIYDIKKSLKKNK